MVATARRGRSRRPDTSAPDPRWWCAGVARLMARGAGVADTRASTLPRRRRRRPWRRRCRGGGGDGRGVASHPTEPPAAPGAAALHASSRISTPARSSISVPAARRRTAPEAADVRTTSERVSLSPCLMADQVSPRCASTLPVADITSKTYVSSPPAGSGAPAAATAVGANPARLSGPEQPARHACRDHHDRDRHDRNRHGPLVARTFMPGAPVPRRRERQHELRARAGGARRRRAAVVLDAVAKTRLAEPADRSSGS
jgi:hypothetical protein